MLFTKKLTRIVVATLLAAVCGVFGTFGYAQPPAVEQSDELGEDEIGEEQEQPAATPSITDLRSALEDVFDQIWAPRSRFTDGPHVRKAFRETIAQAREATVEIRRDRRRLAYGGVVGPDGWVLTKASLVLGGRLEVRLADGRRFVPRIVGVDRENDLAMLKINASQLATLNLAPRVSRDAKLLVSADRSDLSSDDADRSEVAASEVPESISPLAGDWVATVGLRRDPVAIGVVSVAPRTIRGRRGILGIQMADDPKDAAEGIRIEKVYAGTGAAAAGLQAGDRVTEIDRQPVATRKELQEAVQSFHPGDEIGVTYLRGELLLRTTAVLTGQVDEIMQPNRSQYQNSLGGQLSERRFGFQSALQHDTVLDPNECGGPIVDLEGRVVGFNIARSGRTESYAIPTEAVRQRLYELMSGRLAPANRTEDVE